MTGFFCSASVQPSSTPSMLSKNIQKTLSTFSGLPTCLPILTEAKFLNINFAAQRLLKCLFFLIFYIAIFHIANNYKMPGVCMVKACPYRIRPGEKYSIHKFASTKPEIIQEWREIIDIRTDLEECSFICSLHFSDDCFFTKGNKKCLKPDSMPLPFKVRLATLFLVLISNYSIFKEYGEKALNIKPNPNINEADVAVKDKQTYLTPSEVKNERINRFEDFVLKLASFEDDASWKKHWNIFEQYDGICFYRLSRDDYFHNVTMTFKILIGKQMQVVIYKNEVLADRSELDWILKVSKLERWSQFHRLLEYYQTDQEIRLNNDPTHQLQRALECLNKIWDSEDNNKIVDPIKQQISSGLSQLSLEYEAIVKVEIDDDDFFMQELINPSISKESLPIVPELMSGEEVQLPVKQKTKKPRHNRISSDLEDENVKCDHCEKIFPKKAIRRHVYVKHVIFSLIPTMNLLLIFFNNFFSWEADFATDAARLVVHGKV